LPPGPHRPLAASLHGRGDHGLHRPRHPSIAQIPQHAILERANTTLRYPVPFADPKAGKTETRD